MILKFLVYLLVGITINWVAVICTWGLLGVVTKDDMDLYRELYQKYDRMKVGRGLAGRHPFVRILINLVAWPLSVLDHLYFGGQAVIEAMRRKRDRNKD